MLVLNRKVGEEIKIGDDITIVVLESSSYAVRVGIAAPKEVSVHRGEIYDKIVSGEKPEGVDNPRNISTRDDVY